jgi:hypothetical protein
LLVYLWGHYTLLDTNIVLLLRQSNMSGFVIPAEAGIQAGAGCPIESGMTALAYLHAGLIIIESLHGLLIQQRNRLHPAALCNWPRWSLFVLVSCAMRNDPKWILMRPNGKSGKSS